MSHFKLIISIVLLLLLIGCFVISPKQSFRFVVETAKSFVKFVIVVAKEGKDLIVDVASKIDKEKKQ